MTILIEGPDGSGKSTLAKFLVETSPGALLIHGGGPPASQKEARKRIEGLLASARTKQNCIYDRNTMISEMVYGDLSERTTMMPAEGLQQALRLSIEYGLLFIYCRPPLRVLEKNLFLLDRDKAHKSTDHCVQVRNRYWEIAEKYDEVFATVEQMGGTILRYAWGSQQKEEP